MSRALGSLVSERAASMVFSRGILFNVVLSIFIIAIACEDLEDTLADFEDKNTRFSIIETYQAEDHTFQSGCLESSKKNGYTGSGYMDYGRRGSLVEWANVKAPSTGMYTLIFHYANGSGDDRPCQVTAGENAVAGNVAFPTTGRWKIWKTASIRVKLKAGQNKIRVTADTNSGGPNLDKMELVTDDDGGGDGGDVVGECAEIDEGDRMVLSCPQGKIIGGISFASYGTPRGSCDTGFTVGNCHSPISESKVKAACLNKQSCNLDANNGTFDDPCPGTGKNLAVTFSCVRGDGDDSNGGKKLKVFILAGQSNMEGKGVVSFDDPADYNGGKGNLEYVMQHSPLKSKYRHLKDGSGNWTVRDDVWIRYVRPGGQVMKGGLSIGYTNFGGKSHIGPELQIGHVLGDMLDEQVLLIKTAWGGAALHLQEGNSFHPPSSSGPTGNRYEQMLGEVREALDNLDKEFSGYNDRGYEIAGFIWFQGWNDAYGPASALDEYETNLTNLIRDVRDAWNVPNLPVVIGETGNDGDNVGATMRKLRKAQEAVTKRSEFSGTVAFVPTTDFARPADESPNPGHGHHWYGNAESYFLIGHALGKEMTSLLDAGDGGGGGDDNDDAGDDGGGGGGDIIGGCAELNEGQKTTLSCPAGEIIGGIGFASYGTPKGSCGTGFSIGNCHSSKTKSAIRAACLNKQSCKIAANNGTFDDPCSGVGKKLAVTYSCVTGEDDSYDGTGEPLPLAQYMLGECNPDEQALLKTKGFTKFAYVSVGNWTNIGTIQGSPMLPQWLLDSVAREFKRALEPIIERFPDRMRSLLDFNEGTINVVMVWGAGPWGLSAFMGDSGMFFKRNAASDGGFFHELGHVFDIHDHAPGFREHDGSVLAPDDADVLDGYCHKDARFINDNGTCQYSEFVAEKYREMMYPEHRKTLKKTFPEVHDVLLKYIPDSLSYVPFPDHEYLE